MAKNKITWSKEQLEIIQNKGKNLLVDASAGCGKSTVMVERIINKIIEENISIQEMLIITFTKKAAAELRSKLQNELMKIINDDSAHAKEKTFIIKQLSTINNANISTIHSFCQEVVKSNFYQLNLDPTIQLIDEKENKVLLENTISKVLEKNYASKKPSFINLVESYTSNKNDDGLREMLKSIYYFIRNKVSPFEWLEKNIEYFKNFDEEKINVNLWTKELKEILLYEIKEYYKIAKRVLKTANDYESKKKFVILEDCQKIELMIELLEKDFFEFSNYLDQFEFSRSSSKREDLNINTDNIIKLYDVKCFEMDGITSDKETDKKVGALADIYRKWYKKLIKKITNIPINNITERNEALSIILKEIYSLVKEIDFEYQTAKANRNVMDYNDLESYAIRILEDKAVAQRYKEQFEYIFIDEYQDTSEIQDKIIKSIERDNNLFFVGDLKQSIYKFRNAEPTLFIEKKEVYSNEVNSKVIPLNTNFRSQKNVLDGVNYFFDGLMSKSFGELEYNENAYLKLFNGNSFDIEDELGTKIELFNINSDNTLADEETQKTDSYKKVKHMDNSEVEAYYIAKKINDIIGKEFYDFSNKIKRKIRYSDIVILMRSPGSWSKKFEEVFSAYNIPLFYDGSKSYFQSIEITVVINLLKVLLNRREDIALLSVMRSHIGNFEAKELLEIRENSSNIFYYAMQDYVKVNDNDLSKKIISFQNNIEKWHKQIFTLSLADFLINLLEETNYLSYVSAMPGGKKRGNNLKLLIKKAKDFSHTSYSGIDSFLLFIESLEDNDSDVESAKELGENDNVVTMMSIHKSKGLEFPIVFLARNGNKITSVIEDVPIDNDLGIGLDYIDYKARIKYRTLSKHSIKKKKEYEQYAEEMRLLYVAMTRAVNKLYIYGTTNKEDKEEKAIEKKEILFAAVTYMDWFISVLKKGEENNKKILSCDNDGVISLNEIFNINEIKLFESEVLDRFVESFLIDNNQDELQNKFEQNTASPLVDYNKLFVQKKICKDYRLRTIPASSYKNYTSEKTSTKVIPKTIPNRLIKKDAKTKLKAHDIGNLYHKVMELLDFTQTDSISDIESQLKNLKTRHLIDDIEFNNIDINKIYNFFSSELGKKISESSIVEKELPILFKKDKLLINGIIDLCFNDNDTLYIVDYKTDKITGDINQYIDEYKNQLLIYKEALKEIKTYDNIETYLYFFNYPGENKCVKV